MEEETFMKRTGYDFTRPSICVHLRSSAVSMLFAAAVLGMAGSAVEAAPRLNWMLPSGGQRGTTFKAVISGTGLDTLTGFISTGASVTAKVLPAEAGADA